MSGVMAAGELDVVDHQEDNDEDVGLSDRQIAALEKLEELGAEPRKEGDIYDPNPKVRALQLVYEGRLGGPGRGQGRKRQPRASEFVASKIREEGRAKKIVSAIDRALDDDNARVALDGVRTAMDIEHKEAALQLREDEFDRDTGDMDREGLIRGIIEFFSDPEIAASLGASSGAEEEGQAALDIPEADVIEDDTEAEEPVPRRSTKRAGSSARAEANGHQRRAPGGNGRRAASPDLQEGKNPWSKAAKRRAAN